MSVPLDDGLKALGALNLDGPLDGLEAAVLGQVERRRRDLAAASSPRMQIALAAAALAIGVIVGIGSAGKPQAYGSENRVLSDDSGLAPSIRLGGA